MDAWRLSSPYAGIGIYVGGSNRLCDQPELDARLGAHPAAPGLAPAAAVGRAAGQLLGLRRRMSSDLAAAERAGASPRPRPR